MNREAVGRRYDAALMQRARDRSWAVLQAIHQGMQPGIGEDEAKAMAAQLFAQHGVERLWHPPIIRIGANTTKTYRQRSNPDVRLAGDDIYFIDLGLVFDGHEGDVGDTLTIGNTPQHQACAEAARTLFDEVAGLWRREGRSGRALYEFATERAQAMGWRFNHAIKGHRLGDYPHSVHKGGDLGTLEGTPSPGLWVLEIQIAHPTEPFGAFYEDLLGAERFAP
jgi:Xaa-Pro aminopeptidase